MKVIGLAGGPGCGKTTTGLGLTFNMKKLGLNVVFVQEYAQELVNEGRTSVLEDQFYITAKQNRKLARLINGNYDFVVTDSPLYTGLLYTKPDYHAAYEQMVMSLYRSYDNCDYILERSVTRPFNPIGRVQQTMQEANVIDDKLKALLKGIGIAHKVLPASDIAIAMILAEHGYG